MDLEMVDNYGFRSNCSSKGGCHLKILGQGESLAEKFRVSENEFRDSG